MIHRVLGLAPTERIVGYEPPVPPIVEGPTVAADAPEPWWVAALVLLGVWAGGVGLVYVVGALVGWGR